MALRSCATAVPVALRISSTKSGSSNATRSTSITAAYNSSAAARSTWGASADCSVPTPAVNNAPTACALTTHPIAGNAANTRAAVGPCASSWVNTFAVANNPHAVLTPDPT